MIARRVRVTGRVQGVGYRAWAAAEADRLGLHGFVRNRLDGSVELLLRGSEAAVGAMIEACRSGPTLARVEGVAVEEAAGLVPDRFETKPTV